jgi:hypothetical protein
MIFIFLGILFLVAEPQHFLLEIDMAYYTTCTNLTNLDQMSHPFMLHV